jgi:sulfide:quinone oxidoreductase
MAVDKHTLQSLKYPNIFGVGDVTGVPNSKTAAAIRKQVPVVVQNLLSVMKGQKSSAAYDGYSSCPLVTGFGKVILAEFGYDGKLMPSFPIDATVERKSMWILKRHMLPILYWNGMLKGRA